MSKREKILAAIASVVCVIALAGVGWYFLFFQKSEEPIVEDTKGVSLDSKKEATHISKVAGTEGAYWLRGFDVVWNEVEPVKGEYDWKSTDDRLTGEVGGEAYFLSIIWPYANWDQTTCHEGDKYLATGHLKRGGEDLYMGAPCDMAAYGEFIGKIVERYDGDGIEDMPGLKTPVKYWEILNEPSMQGGSLGGAGEDLKFFVGTSAEYLEILKTSYESIKKADPDAKVLHAGMAGMQQSFQDFWDPVFAGGGGDYFDIANIHTISTDERRHDSYMIKFKRYLEKFDIKDKPIWITEMQFGDLMGKPTNVASFEILMAKSAVFSLALGADKLFLIENWVFWDDEDTIKLPEPTKDKEDDKKDYQEKDPKKPKPKPDLSNSSTHKVYLNLLDKLGSFDKVETIMEEFSENSNEHDGATSFMGVYKFTDGDKVVYVLWSDNTQTPLPPEISGKVKVTDIYGTVTEMTAGEIRFSESPIFVELIK